MDDDNIHLSPEFVAYIKARMDEQAAANTEETHEQLHKVVQSLATNIADFYRSLRKEGVPRGVAAALSQALLLKLISPR